MPRWSVCIFWTLVSCIHIQSYTFVKYDDSRRIQGLDFHGHFRFRFILSAGKTRPHNSAYYMYCNFLHDFCNGLHAPEDGVMSLTNKTRHSNAPIPSNTIQYRSDRFKSIVVATLESQQGGLCASHCDRQRIPRYHAVRSTLFQCVFGY